MSLLRNATWAFSAICALAAPAGAMAQDSGTTVAPPQGLNHYQWVTLGTQGGPMPGPNRGEPANLLLRNGNAILVDVGDGAMTKMVAAGAQYSWLSAIFISHLHVDHIGGLLGVIGLRNQTRTTVPLTIYGPPGTRALVAGIVAGLGPSAESGFGVPGEVETPPSAGLTVVEINDGSVIRLGDMTVRAVKNTHYSFPPGSEMDQKFASLSFRFELPDRSIVYTGDTGPSAAVERLAQGADLLVSEMIDLQATMTNLSRGTQLANATDAQLRNTHLTTHHMSTRQVGAMAAAARVKAVVITHIAGGGARDPGAAARYAAEVQGVAHVPVTVANDLDRF